MELMINLTGKTAKPRIINVKQYSALSDNISFCIDELPFEGASCFIVGDTYRQGLELSGNIAKWCIPLSFTQKSGCFDIQLELKSGEHIWKSDVMLLIVSESTEGEKQPSGENKPTKGTIQVYGTIEDEIVGEAALIEEG